MKKIYITENQYGSLIGDKLLLEMVSDVVFHHTYPSNLLNILQTNKIRLTPSFGIEADRASNYNKLYSLSLTTARNTVTGFKATGKNFDVVEGRVRLQMDGRKLNANYKSKHVDYWQYPRTKEFTEKGGSYDEMEDRILSDKNEISPASNYIVLIEIFVKDTKKEIYHQIKDYAEQLGIPCYFYNTSKDFNFSIKKNAIDIGGDIVKTENYKTDQSRYAIGLAALASFKNDFNKNKIIEYAKSNNLDVPKIEQEIEKRISRINEMMWGVSFEDLIRTTQADIQNSRSNINDNFTVFVVSLIGNEMKKNGVKSIADYITYKKFIGKKTQQDFNKEFYNEIANIIDKTYNEELKRINGYNFNSIDGEYYNGDVTTYVPELKKELEKIVNEIKKYLQNNILKNDDMFQRVTFFYSDVIKEALNLRNINYEFADDIIDYSESALNDGDIRAVIYAITNKIDDFCPDYIKRIKEEYNSQFYN